MFTNTLKIILLVFLLTTSLRAEGNTFLKIEVQCPQSFKSLTMSDLCSQPKCSWKSKNQSKRASIWLRGQGKLEAIEVPNQKLVRFKYFNGEKSVSLKWCSLEREFSWKDLVKEDLEQLKRTGETLYLLSPSSKSSAGTWNMLKAINHPCRVLITKKNKGTDMVWTYLKPIKKKACD